MDERGQMTFYRSYFEAINSLPKKDRLPVYEAILAYGLDGTEPKLSGVQLAVFTLVRPTLDTSRRKAKSGKAGGKAEANRKQNESKPEASGKQTAGEKEKEIEIEKEIENENECYILQGGADSDESLPPVIQLPLIDKSLFPVSQEQVTEWSGLYPAVDVMQELRNMLGWCKGNPTKLKTRKGILRFILSWLAREQDKGGRPAAPQYGKKDIPKGASGYGSAEDAAIAKILAEDIPAVEDYVVEDGWDSDKESFASYMARKQKKG